MSYLYLLQDDNKKLYIGYTNNLKRRLVEHKNKKVYTTRRMTNPKLIYYECYNNENLTKIRERKLKQYGSAYHGLKKRLNLK